jgi:hypothetical protein
VGRGGRGEYVVRSWGEGEGEVGVQGLGEVVMVASEKVVLAKEEVKVRGARKTVEVGKEGGVVMKEVVAEHL